MKDKVCRNCEYYCYEEITCGYICVNEKSEHCADWIECDNTCDYWEGKENE